jgi:hypothetical protein
MRIHAIGGILCFIFAATSALDGGSPKATPFRELSSEDLDRLLGDWEAAIQTKAGWKGTLSAHITLKRNHPELSTFHALLVLRYDLRFTGKKSDMKSDKKIEGVASGSEKRALIPFEKDKQRYVQCLRDFQVLQKEFFEEAIELNSQDNKSRKGLADLQPTQRDTASFVVAGNTWTLEMAPVLREILPRQGTPGPNIDWDSQIVWKKVKLK